MVTKRRKAYSAKPSEINPSWHVVDAAGRPLGRVASEVARILMGKHKPIYTPHLITGDYVVVINATQIGVTGRKPEGKQYFRYSGYPGGLKVMTLNEMLARHPDRVIKHAVWGMLPKNSLAKHILQRLKVYPGADHPHQAQIAESQKRQAKAQAQPKEAKE